MFAKLKIYSSSSTGFKQYTYWAASYKTVLYLDLEFNKSTTEVTSEIDQDEIGQNNLIFQSNIQKDSFNFLAINSILHIFQNANLHDTVEIEFLETGETYTIENITINEAQQQDKALALITIEFESQAAINGNCENDYTVIVCP